MWTAIMQMWQFSGRTSSFLRQILTDDPRDSTASRIRARNVRGLRLGLCRAEVSGAVLSRSWSFTGEYDVMGARGRAGEVLGGVRGTRFSLGETPVGWDRADGRRGEVGGGVCKRGTLAKRGDTGEADLLLGPAFCRV